MCAASTRLALSLRRIWSWKVLRVLSEFCFVHRSEAVIDIREWSFSPVDNLRLLDVKDTTKETTLCIAAAHALVQLDDGTVVGDPMERTTLDALDWKIGKGDQVAPASGTAPHRSVIHVRRRFQFSSALKRMSTISTLPTGKVLVSVKGAPETIKTMLEVVPEHYDDTYKYFTRRGSRVLALAWKEMGVVGMDKVCSDYPVCDVLRLIILRSRSIT